MISAGHVVCMEEVRNAYKILVGEPEGKRPIGRPRCIRRIMLRWTLKEIGCGMD